MRKNRYAAFLLWTFLALLCWGTALGGFLENRRGNQEFTAYYDSPVLNGKEMEIFIREREEEGLPLTAAWKEEEKESFEEAAKKAGISEVFKDPAAGGDDNAGDIGEADKEDTVQ